MSLNSIGQVLLPVPYYGIISGTYTGYTTRIIDVKITKPEGALYLPSFPTTPGSVASMDCGSAITVGIVTSRKDPDSDKLIVTVDRGYTYEATGLAQPERYGIPSTGGKLIIGSSASFGKEAASLISYLNPLVAKQGTGSAIYGLVWGSNGEMEITATDPASMDIQIDSGLIILETGIIYFPDAFTINIVPTFAAVGQTGWYQIVMIYVDQLTGNWNVLYGEPDSDSPDAPELPENGLALATIMLTQGATTITDTIITDIRVGEDPSVSTVAVHTGRTVDVTFNREMDLTEATTASNYTVSGTGKGSLASNPNSVASITLNSYRLTWSAGEMVNGGDITVTVGAIHDAAGDALSATNSGTDTGGGIGVAPTIASSNGVVVETGLTVNITFSEPMGDGVTTASNYIISGTGKGTLATNPNSVSSVSGNTYCLTWNSGEMKNGSDVTITVTTGIKDVAGNPFAAPESKTHTGGGIGVAPTVSTVDGVAVGGHVVDVTFSETTMGANVTTAANYTVSGTGKGTLGTATSNHPLTVASVSGAKYRLTFTDTETAAAGDVIITVANVTDLAGNVVGSPNSGTATIS